MHRKLLYGLFYGIVLFSSASSYQLYNCNVDNSKTTYTFSRDWPDTLTERTEFNANTKIAVLDTGVDFTNPLLKASKYLELDVSTEQDEDKSHGTKVAGILASSGKELTGMLPGVNLISIKLGGTKGWDIETLIKGIELAVSVKADVINISGGTDTDNETLRQLVKNVTDQGIVIVAAAGNKSQEGCEFPAAYPEVLSVGAVDRNLNITSSSNYGPKVKIFAPGEDILTTLPYQHRATTTRFSGSSAATPFISSLVAIMKSNNPTAKPDEIGNAILNSADIVTTGPNAHRVVNYKKSIAWKLP